MRDLSDTEWDILRDGHCPYCGHTGFREGPHGGLAVNIFCKGCGAGFNVCPGVPFRPQLIEEPSEGMPEHLWAKPVLPPVPRPATLWERIRNWGFA